MQNDWALYLPKPFSSPKTSVKGCPLVSEHVDCRSWFLYQPVLSSACRCLCEHVMEKRSRYFCLKQKNKQAKHIARYWAKGSIFGSPVCVCACICICIYMCVCICIYTESEWEYLCIGLMNLTGAKSLLKKKVCIQRLWSLKHVCIWHTYAVAKAPKFENTQNYNSHVVGELRLFEGKQMHSVVLN